MFCGQSKKSYLRNGPCSLTLLSERTKQDKTLHGGNNTDKSIEVHVISFKVVLNNSPQGRRSATPEISLCILYGSHLIDSRSIIDKA